MPQLETPDRPSEFAGRYRLALYTAFGLSGVAGLVHEVTWTRLLRLVMGSTSASIATVLAVFMGGLALGSLLGGRWVDRRRDPLGMFAFLEGATGAYCLLLPRLIDAVEPIYRTAYQAELGPVLTGLIRFVLCAIVLLIPATMMGATLPVLTRWLVRSLDQTGSSVGRLYALNTLGAAAGASLAAFWFVPGLGVNRTIFIGACLNGIAAVLGYRLHRRMGLLPEPQAIATAIPIKERAQEAPPSEPGRYGRHAIRILLIGYGVAGLAAMVLQIAWTRVLTLLIGSSVYAFGLILTAFILGLGLGSLLYGPFADRVKDPLRRLAWIQVLIGLSALVVVPFFDAMPFMLTRLIAHLGEDFWQLQAMEFGLVLAITLIPTFLMGAAFPLVTCTFTYRNAMVGRSVGTVYMSNTIGAIVGSILGGFVFIPTIGLQNTLYAAIALSLLVGISYVLASLTPPRWFRLGFVGATVAIAGLAMALVPHWNPSRMSFGPFVRAIWLSQEDAQSRQAIRDQMDRYQTIYYHEGVSATVSVRRYEDGTLTLLTNGRIEASSRGGELQQRLLAHIPLLLHPNAQEALVIGLASGITLDAAAQHPLSRLDCAELSPGVIDATRFFDDFNHHVLDDPRVNLIVADGRSHLTLTDRKYDVIISQPSDPATAGVASLFTREFFDTCYQRLNNRGLVCVWLKASTVDPDVFRSVVRTFERSFDDISIWSAAGFSEYLLVGSRGRMEIDVTVLAQRIVDESIARDMRAMRITDVPGLMMYQVTGRRGAVDFAMGAPLHTDDQPVLEFDAPRTVFTRKNPQELVKSLLATRDSRLDVLQAPPSERAAVQIQQLRQTVANRFDAAVASYDSSVAFAQRDPKQALELLMKAGKLNPNDPRLVALLEKLRARMTQAVEAERFNMAVDYGWQIVRLVPESEPDLRNLASLLRDHGAADHAVAVYAQIASLDPDSYLAHYNLARLHERLGRRAQAVQEYQRAIEIKPDLHQALNNLAWLIVSHKDEQLAPMSQAVAYARRACELTNYNQPDYMDTLGAAFEADGELQNAMDSARRALTLATHAGRSDLEHQARSRIARMETIVREVSEVGVELSRRRRQMSDAVHAKQFKQAIQIGQRIVELAPQSVVDRMNLAVMLRDYGSPLDAAQQYVKVLQLQPKNHVAHFNLAKLLTASGQYEDAARHYRIVLSLTPDQPLVMNNLAWLIASRPEAKLGTADEALALADGACRLTEYTNPDLLDTLAQAYENSGEIEKALAVSRRALQLAADVKREDLVQSLGERISRYQRQLGSHDPSP